MEEWGERNERERGEALYLQNLIMRNKDFKKEKWYTTYKTFFIPFSTWQMPYLKIQEEGAKDEDTEKIPIALMVKASKPYKLFQRVLTKYTSVFLWIS